MEYEDEQEDEQEYENIQVKDFDDLSITTITMVMTLDGFVNPVAAFHLLPITHINFVPSKKKSKVDLPWCDVPGSILSMRYEGSVRGIIRSSNPHSFKNSVTIDISTSTKNISVKLSPEKMQMCGSSSRNDGLEAANLIIRHLQKIQSILDRLENDQRAIDTVEWVKDFTRGNVIIRTDHRFIPTPSVKLVVEEKSLDNEITVPLEEIPDNVDKEVAYFLLSLAEDFIYHSDYRHKLSMVKHFRKVFDGNLSVKDADQVMVNYNYSLGFIIDREKLNEVIDGQDGFFSRFNPLYTNSVTIELPYDPAPNPNIKRRKTKVPHITFLIYRSGSVTQSGPGGKMMRKSYYRFMEIIMRHRDIIEEKVPLPPSNKDISPKEMILP